MLNSRKSLNVFKRKVAALKLHLLDIYLVNMLKYNLTEYSAVISFVREKVKIKANRSIIYLILNCRDGRLSCQSSGSHAFFGPGNESA